jgi:hypothetical protein
VIAYALRKFQLHEETYVTHDLELAMSAWVKNLETLLSWKKIWIEERLSWISTYISAN